MLYVSSLTRVECFLVVWGRVETGADCKEQWVITSGTHCCLDLLAHLELNWLCKCTGEWYVSQKCGLQVLKPVCCLLCVKVMFSIGSHTEVQLQILLLCGEKKKHISLSKSNVAKTYQSDKRLRKTRTLAFVPCFLNKLEALAKAALVFCID